MLAEALSVLEARSELFLVTVAFFALLIGSFLNVVIYRLPKILEADWREQCAALTQVPSSTTPVTEAAAPAQSDTALAAEGASAKRPLSLAWPPSSCPSCGHRIRAIENIPVLSWLALRGRCSACATAIPVRYPLVEAACALVSVIVAWRFGFGWMTVVALGFTWVLLALTAIDYDTQLLPDNLTLPLLWAGLIVNSSGLFVPLETAVWGAVWGYLSLWSVYHLFRLLTGKEGMGYGDFKLLAALGAWCGWMALPAVILISSLVGALVGIAMVLFAGHDRARPIPFGPFLAVAGWITLLWGTELTEWWLQRF